MKEIKYRAWEKNLKEIIPVHNIDFVNRMINTGSAWRLFDEIKLMRFIGKTDKNGKEIYEGDIVQIKHFYKNREHTGKVVYCLNRFEVEDFYFPHYDDPSNAFESGMGIVEVVGNIYENPELLNKN
jgi:uncharacterized phage protein (TIGR01671 family)